MLPPPVRISSSSTPTSSANSTASASAWFRGSGRRTRRKSTWATNISECCSSTKRIPARPISNCRFSRLIWTSRGCSRNSVAIAIAWRQTSSRPAGAARFDLTKSMYWPQAREQPIELVGNHAPIAQPIAREAHHHVGCVDAPFVETDTRHWTGAVAGAAHEKAWCWLIIDQILTLIGRAVAECDHGQSSRPGRGLGGGIARSGQQTCLDFTDYFQQGGICPCLSPLTPFPAKKRASGLPNGLAGPSKSQLGRCGGELT